jgi:hypothetical protein
MEAGESGITTLNVQQIVELELGGGPENAIVLNQKMVVKTVLVTMKKLASAKKLIVR